MQETTRTTKVTFECPQCGTESIQQVTRTITADTMTAAEITDKGELMAEVIEYDGSDSYPTDDGEVWYRCRYGCSEGPFEQYVTGLLTWTKTDDVYECREDRGLWIVKLDDNRGTSAKPYEVNERRGLADQGRRERFRTLRRAKQEANRLYVLHLRGEA